MRSICLKLWPRTTAGHGWPREDPSCLPTDLCNGKYCPLEISDLGNFNNHLWFSERMHIFVFKHLAPGPDCLGLNPGLTVILKTHLTWETSLHGISILFYRQKNEIQKNEVVILPNSYTQLLAEIGFIPSSTWRQSPYFGPWTVFPYCVRRCCP